MKTITALLMATLIMCPCSSIMAKNPAASVTDKAQKASISTIKDLDNGRLYVMDYTADYKLDKMLQQNINSVDTMLAFVGRELLGAAKPAPGAIDAGCSAFAGRTEEGKPIYGRNFDYKMKMTAVMVRTAPKDGYRSIGIADAGWVGYDIGSLSDGKSDLSAAVAMPYLIMDGMNEKGLAVSVLKLDGKPTHQRTGKPQITTTAALRLMLDKAANVDEALALLEKYDMNSSMETANFHFLLSDADGKNVVLEYTIDDMAVIDTNYVANHYLAPKMHGLGHAYDRFAVLDSAVKFKKSIFTPFEAMSLLSLVSQPETEEATSMTQWSVVYNLHDLTAQVAIRRNYDKLFNFTLADLSGKAKI